MSTPTSGPLARCTPSMIAALGHVFAAVPDSIHEHGRHPEEWVRMERRSTVDGLVSRGLVEHTWQDHPDGWRGKLTEAGLAARAAAIALREDS